MKKLVTALALCASFSAFAQVESANVVGYQTLSVTNTYKDIVSSFVTVGGDQTSIKLRDIVPSAGFKNGVGTLTFFASSGVVDKTAMYVDGIGWLDVYENDPADYNEIVIPAGKGFFAASSASYTLTLAGEVKFTQTPVPLGTYTVVGNASPVPIKLGDIVPSSGFKNGVGTVTFFAPNGTVSKTAMYVDGIGWLDVYENDPADYNLIPLEACDGVFVSTGVAGQTLTLPAISI